MAVIHTLWAWRKDEDGPELLEAWDDFSVGENHAGWQRACERALAAMEDDISELGHRVIEIKIDFDAIEQAFYPAEVEGTVTASQSEGV